MAQKKLLFINSVGLPEEHNSANDELTMLSVAIHGGGPALSATGLAMANTDVSGVQDIVFQAPSTATINQTAGNLIVDDLMAKERSNVMTTASDILFPVVTDVAGEVDAFRLPALAGAPTATPTAGGTGHLVFDSSAQYLYFYNGSAWEAVPKAYDPSVAVQTVFTAGEAVTAVDAVYISSADSISIADCTDAAKTDVIGFAIASASAAAEVRVQQNGELVGFTGLTAGARYYLSTAGTISASVPSGTGNTIVQVGVAKAATKLLVKISQLGRRA